MLNSTPSPQKKALRSTLRLQRQQLSITAQQSSSKQITKHISALSLFQSAQHIAFYISTDSEVSLAPLITHTHMLNKRCYLPKIGHESMDFRLFEAKQDLIKNRYGIPEPTESAPKIEPDKLDMVLIPLVGFDQNGNRLGMGGGFYDRFFADAHTSTKRPTLVGIAHACQEVDQLNSDPWDIPMDLIATNQTIIYVNN